MVRYNRPNASMGDEEFKRVVAAGWPKNESKQFAIVSGTFTDDSPDTNSVAWASCVVEYDSATYDITDDNTSDAWIYWDLSDPTVFATSATLPSVTSDVIIVGKNTAGAFTPSWKSGQGTMAEMVVGTLVADQISVTELSAISANLGTITAGSVTGITVTGATLQTEATADRGVKITTANGLSGYNSSGDLTFRIHPTTGLVTAESFTGTDTRTFMAIDAHGVFRFRDLRYRYGIKLSSDGTRNILRAYDYVAGTVNSADMAISGAGASGVVRMKYNNGEDTCAEFGSAGLNMAAGKVIKVNSTQVLGAQQAAEADAAAVSSISLDSGSDSVDRAAFNTSLGTLVSEINALKTTVNSLLAKLRTHGIIAT
jgi:hypothetical protein